MLLLLLQFVMPFVSSSLVVFCTLFRAESKQGDMDTGWHHYQNMAMMSPAALYIHTVLPHWAPHFTHQLAITGKCQLITTNISRYCSNQHVPPIQSLIPCSRLCRCYTGTRHQCTASTSPAQCTHFTYTPPPCRQHVPSLQHTTCSLVPHTHFCPLLIWCHSSPASLGRSYMGLGMSHQWHGHLHSQQYLGSKALRMECLQYSTTPPPPCESSHQILESEAYIILCHI